MPLLGGLLVALFEKVFGQWADTLTRKAAIITAAVTAISVLTAAMIASLSALVASIVPALPSAVGAGVWLFVPSNSAACLGIIFSTDAAVALYRWSRANVVLAAQVAG